MSLHNLSRKWALCLLAPILLLLHPAEFMSDEGIAKEIEALVRAHYINPDVDFEPCREGIIKEGPMGFNECLDKYSVYKPKHAMKISASFERGWFGGVGFSTKHCKAGNYKSVYYVGEGTPAHKAEILPGDLVTHIGGYPVSLPASERETTTGSPGTFVTIDLKRNGKMIRVELERQEIHSTPIKYRIYDDVGYVWFTGFNYNNVLGKLRNALDELIKQDVKKVILDMRYNIGGSVLTASEFLSWFVDEKIYYSTIDSSGIEKRAVILPDGRYANISIVILINRHTKSAAERVTGLLQENGVKIIGSISYGKGTRVSFWRLKNGSELILSCAKYLIGGRNIEGSGIIPDIKVMNPINVHGIPECQPHDPELHERQLQTAIEVLREEIAESQ